LISTVNLSDKRIVFFGTPEFAAVVLQKIISEGFTVSGVVTVPDKPQGRGKQMLPSAVKKVAMDYGLPVLQPEKHKDPIFLAALAEFNADVFVVVAYRILPPEVFDMPPLGSFNLHASLLPKYRGAAPIHWAIINGEQDTGVTTFKLSKGIDTGGIYLQESVAISPEENLGSLYEKLAARGSELVIHTLAQLFNSSITVTPQTDEFATLAPKITKELGLIDWNKPAPEINNLIRGLSPTPCAYFLHNGKVYKIHSAKVSNQTLNIGEIHQSKSQIIIGCASGSLEVLELQAEGKRKMNVVEFLRGNSL